MLRIGQRDSSAHGAHGPAAAPLSEASLLKTIRRLWPYIWPRGRRDLEIRVAIVFLLLVVSKLFNAMTPYAFKWATDALAEGGSGAVAAVGMGAVGFTLLMGAIRITAVILMQARDGIFAAVAMHAVRRLATDLFVHMHELSLRFHIGRKTGGLTRVLERGRNAIETLSRLIMSTGAPTLIEMVLVLGVFLYQFDWRYGFVLIATLAAYFAYTTLATNWRIAIRRQMNESDTDANQKAIDSLLNYETVKYFGAEEREAARYDKKASTHSYVSLAVLNAGQTVIYIIGLTVMMTMCVYGIRDGRNTIGDFVLINAMMIQLAQPLNFMGTFYREVRQAIIDIETMFSILSQSPEIADKPGARPLAMREGHIVFDNVQFHYDANRPILKGVSFEAAPGKTIAIVGPSGAGKTSLLKLLFLSLRATRGLVTVFDHDTSRLSKDELSVLRRRIGMVFPLPVGLPLSVYENVAYAPRRAGIHDPARLDPIVEDCLRRAMLWDEVKDRLDQLGTRLSGGQQQRSSCGPKCCSPTSRRAMSIRRWPNACCGSSSS